MKTIGIIGGLAWPSSLVYYQKINEAVSARLGGRCSVRLVFIQTDYDQMRLWVHSGAWEKVGQAILCLQKSLKAAGADFFLVACNTVHQSLLFIQDRFELPFIHIVDASARQLKGYRSVGLLGSRITMTEDYFVGRLSQHYGLEVMVPSVGDQQIIQSALKEELANGDFLEATRRRFRQIICDLVERGAEVIILGCTEFGRLVKEEDSSVPIIDTLIAHVEATVDMALEEQN